MRLRLDQRGGLVDAIRLPISHCPSAHIIATTEAVRGQVLVSTEVARAVLAAVRANLEVPVDVQAQDRVYVPAALTVLAVAVPAVPQGAQQ